MVNVDEHRVSQGATARLLSLAGLLLACAGQFCLLRQEPLLPSAWLGERFNVRRYHDRLLGIGTATLPVIGELLDEWLAEEAEA